MRLPCWKMFAGSALLGVLAAPASAQRIGQPFGTLAVGIASSRGNNYVNGDGFIRDVLVGVHIGRNFAPGQHPRLTVAAAVGEEFVRFDADVCVIRITAPGEPVPGCIPTAPPARYAGLLGGGDLRGSGGSISFLVGPTAVFTYAPPSEARSRNTNFAVAARIDAFVNLPTGHAALGISLRDSHAPNFQGRSLNSRSMNFGLRVQ